MVLGNENELIIPIFPQFENFLKNNQIPPVTIVTMNDKDWQKLLKQLDTNEVLTNPNETLNLPKTLVRKSQRIIDSRVTWKVFERDNYTCRYCGAHGIPMSVDHIVLWEDFGDSVEENLVTSCKKCNRLRGNTPFLKWLESDIYKERGKNIPWNEHYHEKNQAAWDPANVTERRKTKRGRR